MGKTGKALFLKANTLLENSGWWLYFGIQGWFDRLFGRESIWGLQFNF
jgi:hypothetical protein